MKKIWMILLVLLIVQSAIVSSRFYGVGQNSSNTPDFERKAKEPSFFEKIVNFFSGITGRIVEGVCEEDSECDDENTCTINDLCLLGECVGEPLCDDGNINTKDYCKDEVCKFVEVSTAGCLRDSDCNDGNQCTEDVCFEKGCFYYEKMGCIDGCRSDKDCDDNNQGTKDSCQNKRCVNVPKTVFRFNCMNDSDCNDGNDCTIGSCESSNCVYNSTACETSNKDYTKEKEKVKESVERFSKIEVPFFVILIFIVMVIFVLAYGRSITVVKKRKEASKIKSSKEIDKMMKNLESRLKKL